MTEKMKTGWRTSAIGDYSGDGETIAWKVLNYEYEELGNDWLLEDVAEFPKIKPTSWENVLKEFRKQYGDREGTWVTPTKKDAIEYYGEYGEPYPVEYNSKDQVTSTTDDGMFVLNPPDEKKEGEIIYAGSEPYYHGTAIVRIEMARKDGALKGPLYVTSNKQHALFFAKTKLSFHPDRELAKKYAVVAELHIPGWPLTPDPDPEAQEGKYKGQLFITESVPFNRIVNLESIAELRSKKKNRTTVLNNRDSKKKSSPPSEIGGLR